jgi:hypothetical protein
MRLDDEPETDIDQVEETAEETGEAGAGDGNEPADHIEAFDNQMDRLETMAVEAEFESGTLVGDIRDLIVGIFKERPKPWSQMSQSQQRDVGKMAEAVAEKVIRKAVRVIAEQDDITVHAALKSYSSGDGFDIKLKAASDEETALQLYRLQGHDVVLISADSNRFKGQKKPIDTQPDEPDLPFSDPRPEIPESDGTETDLADAAEGLDEVDEETAETEEIVQEEAETAENLGSEVEESVDYESRTNPDDDATAPYVPTDDDGNEITLEQEEAWSQVTHVTAKEPEFPDIGASWVKPAEGEVRYWHGQKWYLKPPSAGRSPPEDEGDEA